MTYHGKGSSGEVLKVSGQTSTFGALPLPTTVASGSAQSPDYNTVQAAVAAGAKAISVIGDTFETTNFAISSDIIVKLENGSLWDLDDTVVSGAGRLDVFGNGRLRYNQVAYSLPAITCEFTAGSIEIINASPFYSPLVECSRAWLSDIDMTGNLVLAGSGAIVSSSRVAGSLVVLPTASGANVQQSHIVNGLTIDSGTNTVFSNIKFN